MRATHAVVVLATASILPSSATVGRGITRAPSAIINLRSYAGDLMFADVTVDGVNARMLLDTGGGMTLLTPAMASRTGCHPHGQLVARRMTGEKVTFQKCLPVRIAAGNYSARVKAGVFDLGKLLPPELPPLDGILSLDAFNGQVIRLSLADGSLSVLRPGTRPSGSPGRLSIRRETPGAGLTAFVQAPASTGELDLLLDSGNLDDVLLSPSALAQLGLSAAVKVEEPITLDLHIHEGAAERVRAKARELEIDGALNAKLMRRFAITLDLRHNRIWFEPLPPPQTKGH